MYSLLCSALAILVESLAIAYGCARASHILHDAMLRRCMRAPMTFFDTTPTGRILNRFSKDLDLIDSTMPLQLRQWLFAGAPLVATVIVISYSIPAFLCVVIPIVIIYLIVQVRSCLYCFIIIICSHLSTYERYCVFYNE